MIVNFLLKYGPVVGLCENGLFLNSSFTKLVKHHMRHSNLTQIGQSKQKGNIFCGIRHVFLTLLNIMLM